MPELRKGGFLGRQPELPLLTERRGKYDVSSDGMFTCISVLTESLSQRVLILVAMQGGA